MNQKAQEVADSRLEKSSIFQNVVSVCIAAILLWVGDSVSAIPSIKAELSNMKANQMMIMSKQALIEEDKNKAHDKIFNSIRSILTEVDSVKKTMARHEDDIAELTQNK